jgi:putative membrane protein
LGQPNQPDVQQDETSCSEYPILLIKGFLMGSADIVPGVSGGTMALIVGIYTRLINAIKSFDITFIKRFLSFKFRSALRDVDWRFMVMLLSGIFSAILFFTKVVPLQVYMFTDPELIYGLFFGLIVGSIFVLAKAIDGFNWMHAMMILIGTGIGFWVVTLVPTETSESPLFVFLSGSVAICAMVLPGISGSYILLILRKYDFMLSQIGKLGTAETGSALLVLLPFVVGAVVGLALFSRVLSWLLSRYEAKTLAVLIGFLVGSLYVIWPYQDRTYQEIETKQKVVAYDHPQAQDLRNNPPDENRPEFKRLKEVAMNNRKPTEQKKVRIVTVKKKLIKSSPFIPYMTVNNAQTPHFWDGIWGIVIGLIMVVGLDYLRVKK